MDVRTCISAYVCACVCACVRACVRSNECACVRLSVCVYWPGFVREYVWASECMLNLTLRQYPTLNIGVRDGGQGAVDPPKFGQIRNLFGQKTTHLFD